MGDTPRYQRRRKFLNFETNHYILIIMPQIKLYYMAFPFWRAEVSRLALHLGNVPFEDVTDLPFKTPEERAALRESGKAPFGQLPVLEVDGKIIAQTGARAKLGSETLPMYFKALEKMMTDNGSTGFYVGKSMTIADLAMWRLLGWINGGALDGLPKDTLDSFPQLQANYLATGNNEKIKAWMAEKYPNFGK